MSAGALPDLTFAILRGSYWPTSRFHLRDVREGKPPIRGLRFASVSPRAARFDGPAPALTVATTR